MWYYCIYKIKISKFKKYLMGGIKMINKEKFMESLSAIVDVAARQNNILSKDEIAGFFENIELTAQQYDMVYEYLTANNITIKHYISDETIADSTIDNIDEEYVKMYLLDIDSIKEPDSEEEKRLFEQLANGNFEVKNRLIEGYLKYVVKTAMEFCGNGVLSGDLIQEGNMGVLEALEKLRGNKNIENPREFIKNNVVYVLKKAIDENSTGKKMEENMIRKADLLSEASKELAEDMGREATVEELAEHMKISIDEVKDIMRLSLEALGVENLH